MTVYAPSKRRRIKNAVRDGDYGPNHLRYGRGAVLANSYKTTVPAQVTGVTATAGSLKATLGWTVIPNVFQYKIEQSNDGSTGWATIASVPGSNWGYVVTGLTASVARFWRVSAVNGDGVAGTVSSTVTATPTA